METSSTENNCIHLSKDDIATFENFKWWIDSVAERTIGLSGIFANCLAIVVLTRKRMTSNFNLLLVCLAIFDIFFIIFSLAEEIENSLSSSVHFNNVWNLIFYPCYHISMTASIYMTVNLSFERYRALVAKPLVAKLFVAKPGRFFPTNSRQTKWVLINVISVVIFSVAFNIPKFYELEFETQYQSDNSTDFQLVFSNLYHDYYFVLFYDNIVRNIVLVVIPFASLTFFNVRIYCLLKNRSNIQTGRHQRNEKQAYVVLLGVVLVLAVCHALRMFLVINLLIRLSSNNVQESLKNGCSDFQPIWVEIVRLFSNLLLTVNSSINFFVYYFSNKTFRGILLQCCGCKTCSDSDLRDSSQNQSNSHKNNNLSALL